MLIGSWLVVTPTTASAEATIVVDTTAPGINESDGKCSLAEAISSANFNLNVAIKSSPPDSWVTTECLAGHIGADTIVLPASGSFTFSSVYSDLYNPMGPTATPIIFSPITIVGNGAKLERTGTTPMRAFAIGYAYVDADPTAGEDIAYGTGELLLQNVHVKNFFAVGGNGGKSAGGGLGAGGAIYVRDATLRVEYSTFEGNRAQGGLGGSGRSSPGAGGGGGGLGGNGGSGTGQAHDFFSSSGGGGGGGARGDGGSSQSTGAFGQVQGGHFGGGGGGTVTDGGSDNGTTTSRAGGLACGGEGGEAFEDEDGDNGCDGGGGGGGERVYDDPLSFEHGAGGRGGYGGGGGGGGYHLPNSQRAPDIGPGGNGGFGGGGGAGATGDDPGQGGFGAGGAGGTDSRGPGGTFGGDGGETGDGTGPGGGGAGLGGAIFSDNGRVTIINSTFTGNSVSHGFAGTGTGTGTGNGGDAGAAVFAVDGDTAISSSTIVGNESTGSGAGVVVYRSTRSGYTAGLWMANTILARNDAGTDGTQECYTLGAVTAFGTGNLFTDNGNCLGEAVATDPGLGGLTVEVPNTSPVLATGAGSSAVDAGDTTQCEPYDQTGYARPVDSCDIGAYEYRAPSSDLAVVTSAVGTAVAGQDASFTVDVSNAGPTTASSLSLTDTLPSGTTYKSMSGSGFSCTGTGPVTCTSGSMPAGGSTRLTLTVTLPSSMASGTSLKNAVSVSSAITDPDTTDNAAEVTTTVVTRADLAATVTGPLEPVAGLPVTYTLGLANNGPSDSVGATMTAAVPTGTTFTSLTAPSGWTCTRPAVGSNGPTSASCTQTMVATATASFTLVVQLPTSAAEGGNLCSSVVASATTTDPTSSNDTAQTCGTVVTRADLRVGQTVSTTGRPGKGTATFVVRVTNAGPSDSQAVELTASSDQFIGPPPSMITTAGATCTVSGSTITCTWSVITSGAAPQVTVTVPWRSSVGQVCVSTRVTATTIDPVPTNNTGSTCTAKK